MKLISFDQSTTNTGYSVFVDKKLYSYATLKNTSIKDDETSRLYKMIKLIEDVIIRHNPDKVLIEDIYQTNIKKGFKALPRLQGGLIYLLKEKKIEFEIIHSTSWKSWFGISGCRKYQKEKSIRMVKDIYKIAVSEDEADAINMGYFYIHK